MATRHYLISYKPADSVVAACALDDRKVAGDAGRAATVLGQLVGTTLPVALKRPLVAGWQPIAIAVADLVLDEFEPSADAQAASLDPYTFRIDRAGGAALQRVTAPAAASVALDATGPKVTLGLGGNATSVETIWLLLEGVGGMAASTVIGQPSVAFALTTPISVGDLRGAMVMRKGYRTLARVLRAS